MRTKNMEPVNVALYGCGTVGGGVVKFIRNAGSDISRRIGRDVEISYVVDSRVDELKDTEMLKGIRLTSDLDAPINDPGVDIVVELIGGVDAASDVIEKALAGGKDVVTANKALLAERAGELFGMARRHGRSVGFEASVAGGIPIIAALRDSFIGEPIHSFFGIVNGTCNYILSRMSREGLSYEDALREAQQKGYAEADPTLDVEGDDSAHKLAILARLVFGVDVRASDIFCRGIRGVDPVDLRYADSLGYKLKLLAVGKQSEGGVELHVHPALLVRSHPLAEVNGSTNAVCLHGGSVGEVTLTGPGAGSDPTASAVAGDIFRIARGVYQKDFLQLPVFGECERAQLIGQGDTETRYYFRLSCRDRAGVLARVAGLLGEHSISIASCIQQEEPCRAEGHVPVIFMTHEVREKNMMDALDRINELDCIDGSQSALVRVLGA